MALLTPDAVYQMLGVTVNEKIIPDGSRWADAAKAVNAGFYANALYKAEKLLCGTGRAQSVTIHNTGDLANVYDDGEQYTRATWPNQNMGSSRVHFFVDDVCAWQDLKAGTGMTAADPEGSAEVSWHAGDGAIAGGGNMTSLSIEIIMGDTAEHDAKARDNGARVAAWLLWKHGLTVDKLVTHTYWVNRLAGKTFADVDTQCTNPIYGGKWCPTYIFGSSDAAVAKKNWLAFKALVKGYLDTLTAQGTGNDKIIWDFLEGQGLNDYGAAGLMGNLYAESGLSPINLQNTYEKSLGYTDAAYTAAVDAGTYANFVHDSAGYGLAQWTYWSRKEALLTYAKSKGRSIGDLGMQLEFLLKELTGYGLLDALKTAASVREASDMILLNFEKPASMNSEETKNKRAGYGQTYYDKFANQNETEEDDMNYYKTLEDVPSYYKPTVKKLVENGALKGTGKSELNVSDDFCRIMTVLDRLGKLD